MVYEPREDSFLLEKQVKQFAKGKVLDMGTGSGIQGKAALTNDAVTSVLFVDIDQEVINQLDVAEKLQSDLFENVEGHFDTIIFNAPYLPNDPAVKDVALDGGKEGWEVTVQFIEQAKDYLEKDGIILLLFSSLTGKEQIEQTMNAQHLHYAIIAEQKIEFETLYVYKIQ